ncbi:MAG: Eco57I restriction-modification methylase domain-containing protein, partial [Gemmatimonadaceae bacterium]
MLSRRECGELLARADSAAGLPAITRAVGFVGDPDPLDRRTRRELGISDDCRRAWIQRRTGNGSGTLRALLLDVPSNRPLRDHLTRIALRLAARGSPLLWLLCGAVRDTRHVALATIDVASARPRVRALVTDCGRVTESDADTLAALTASSASDDDTTYSRWLEVLGREAVTRRFYHAVARQVGALANQAIGPAGGRTRHELALVYATRLLFLAFLESKGWLDGNRAFLSERYAECMLRGGRFHERVVLPLFFGTLNTRSTQRAPAARALGSIPFLNGGLFARSVAEKQARLRFPDAAIGAFMDEVLTRYRFTAREESTDWSEAAIDPEMLGKAFESLMSASSRRASGSYYTPQALVTHVCDSALEHALSSTETDAAVVAALLRGEARAAAGEDLTRLRTRIAALKVLDPACGSGAFLVHVLERLAALHHALGDQRPRDILRRAVLASAIFGVDVNPMAVWLCELRLWLSCVIDSTETDVHRVPPLPNLDRNIRVGDTLLGDGFDAPATLQTSSAPLARMRLRYVRATGRRKAALAHTLDRAVRRYLAENLRKELLALNARRLATLTATRGRDLFGGRRGALPAEQLQLGDDRLHARELRQRLHSLETASSLPFSFPTHFADVLHHGGFDIVLGNPPWVRPHNVGPAMRDALRRRFIVLREATWRHGADLSGARSGFGAQADLAAAFVERGIALLRDGGTLALLVPAKLWKSLAGAGVRRYLLERSALKAVEDWSDAPAVFDAAVYPSLIVAQRQSAVRNAIELTVHRRELAVRWQTDSTSLPFDDTVGSPWLLLPPEARDGFERLATMGIPLQAAGIGGIALGVKTGCNAAFIPDTGCEPVEPSLMRPLLRGEDVLAWRCGTTSRRIIWTHGRSGAPLERLPALAQMHFAAHRYALEQRSDSRGTKWWALFRTEGARYDLPRVVWSDLARTPRAAVLRAGDNTVPLNTCYVVRCRDEVDALTLAALLNSPVAAAWLGALAEPARGGYRRFLAWTMALFPVPDDWARAREVLGSLGAGAVQG